MERNIENSQIINELIEKLYNCIVEHYMKKPVVSNEFWTEHPKAKFVFMDENEMWRWSDRRPYRKKDNGQRWSINVMWSGNWWECEKNGEHYFCMEIPREFTPHFPAGWRYWKDSMVQRPVGI